MRNAFSTRLLISGPLLLVGMASSVLLPIPAVAQQVPAVGTADAAKPFVPSPTVIRATLHAGMPRQKIYGFGGSITFAADSTFDFVGREAAYEALFSELKIDILRLRNWNGYETPGSQQRFEAITRDYADAAHRWSEPARRGPDKRPVRVMFTAWSPPEYLKSNLRVSGREDGTEKGAENVTLARDASGQYRYTAYADWWLASLAKFRTLTGTLPDYIALQNEQDFLPSYEGMKLLPTEGIGRGGFPFAGYDKALAAVYSRVTGAYGADAPKIVGPETFTLQVNSGGVLNVRPYADPGTAEGRATLDRLFGISFHLYGSGAGPKDNDPQQTRFRNALTTADKTYHDPHAGVDKPLFETEYIEGDTLTKLGGIMHESLTTGEAGAYLVWVLTRKYDPSSSMLLSFSLDGSPNLRRHDRFWAMKHFSYFVGENWHRVDAGTSNNAVKVSAYRSPAGDSLVAVAINPTDAPQAVVFTPDGAGFDRVGAVEAYRSTEGDSGEHWHSLGPLVPSQTVEMPPKSMITLRFAKRGK